MHTRQILISSLILNLACGAGYLYAEKQDPGQNYPQKNYSSSHLAPLDPIYFRGATETRGDYYFWAPNEFSSPAATEMMAQAFLRANGEPLLYRFGELTGRKKERFSFLIGENTPEAFFLLGAQSRDKMNIYTPDGKTLFAAGENVKLYNFTYMLIAAVKNPIQGEWAVEVEGEGKYLISVRP